MTKRSPQEARNGKRAMMLYIDAKVYEIIRKRALAQRPPTKPGPMAAEMLRQAVEVDERKGEL